MFTCRLFITNLHWQHFKRAGYEGARELAYKMTQVKKDKDYVSQKFGIPLQEFEEMLNASPASYKDYPNNEKWLTLIYIVYNKIF